METLMRVNSALVRQLRLGKAWSQEHLADCAGVSLRTVQRVEAEGSGSHETVMALASVLGVAPADLRAQEVVPAITLPGYTLGVVVGTVGTMAGVATAWWSMASQHLQGANAGRTYGVTGLLSGLTFAFGGVMLGYYRRARRGVRWMPIAAASTVATIALGILSLALVPRVSAAEYVTLQISGKHGQDVLSARDLVTEAGKPAEIGVAEDYRLIVVPIVQADGNVLLKLKLYIFRNGGFELAGSPSLLVANEHTAAVELSSSEHPPAGERPYRFEVTPIRQGKSPESNRPAN